MDLEKFKSIEQIYLILVFVAPGLITIYFRSLFITGRRPKTLEYTIEYIIISTVYFALLLPLVELVIAVREPNWLRVISWAVLLGIVPALIGVLLGAGSQKGWWRWIFAKVGLSLVNPYPTGWDWVFGKIKR